ncbi:hypothetical protein MB46_17090 [Arthrobacter alpinus]|uniref:EndoS/ChiA family endoglycosidase n=1 Tax=Arthrobacter alpinus TaxID=656366 RepID=UPI00073A699D|nr:hypothetical protein [Arthrobacter alpinus]ALV46940.1 hypothetical protein MB46_17090 [Arthrobacter alpinus]
MFTKRRLIGSAAIVAISALTSAGMLTPAFAKDAAPSTSVGSMAHCQSDPLMMAYYRTWRDTTVPESANSNLPDKNVISMDQIPKGVDVAMVFDAGATKDTEYWETLGKHYVPKLHKQGTRVVYTLWIDQFAKADVALNDEAYAAYAQWIMDTYVTPYGIDGIDVDVESYPQGDGLTRSIGIFNALGKLIGPKSGTDKLFIFDTNQTGSTQLFSAVSHNFSYVLLQAYGRNITGMQNTWGTFADKINSCQFLIGFSFPEEQDRTNWNDAAGPFSEEAFSTSRARDYALWQPTGGQKGGAFVYAIDRDGKAWNENTISPTNFAWTKAVIKAQDDAAGIKTPGQGNNPHNNNGNGNGNGK